MCVLNDIMRRIFTRVMLFLSNLRQTVDILCLKMLKFLYIYGKEFICPNSERVITKPLTVM